MNPMQRYEQFVNDSPDPEHDKFTLVVLIAIVNKSWSKASTIYNKDKALKGEVGLTKEEVYAEMKTTNPTLEVLKNTCELNYEQLTAAVFKLFTVNMVGFDPHAKEPMVMPSPLGLFTATELMERDSHLAATSTLLKEKKQAEEELKGYQNN